MCSALLHSNRQRENVPENVHARQYFCPFRFVSFRFGNFIPAFITCRPSPFRDRFTHAHINGRVYGKIRRGKERAWDTSPESWVILGECMAFLASGSNPTVMHCCKIANGKEQVVSRFLHRSPLRHGSWFFHTLEACTIRVYTMSG